MKQLFKRRLGDYAVKLRTKIAHHADVANNYVVNPPLPLNIVQLVVNRQRLDVAVHFRFDSNPVALHNLPFESDILPPDRTVRP